MKFISCVSVLFLFSCSVQNWKFEDFKSCDEEVKMKEHISPSGDYVLDIPHNWKPFYQTSDSSNLVFEVDSELISDYDPNNLVLFGVVTYDSKSYSDPKREHDKNIKNLFQDYPNLENIETGETDKLGFHSYYLHTIEKNKGETDYVDIYFQLKNEIDSNYCILQLHAPDDAQINHNMCLLLMIAKSFKIVGKHC